MKETRMPPAWAANLVANNGNTIYGVGVITYLKCHSNLPRANEFKLKISFMHIRYAKIHSNMRFNTF